jgi:hypothetical protein
MYYYSLLLVFFVLAYIVSVDSNAATYAVLLWKLLRINIIKFTFMVRMYPRLAFDTWLMKRRLDKLKKDEYDV